VYHANFLKFFERAREDILGPEEVARLWPGAPPWVHMGYRELAGWEFGRGEGQCDPETGWTERGAPQ